MLPHDADTIAALSTPPGESGIAIIRMSGAEALAILSGIFRCGGRRRAPGEWKHRRVYHGVILDTDDNAVDDVMCTVLRGPESYSGEDTVEISSHGNTWVVRRILEVLFVCGARSAEAGEFTRRAFLNGKMDLIQAEAVADLIHARSELQRQVAQEQLSGGLSERINHLAGELLGLLGEIEANIDFIEEDIDTLDIESAREMLARHAGVLDELLASAALERPFREGYAVVMAGPVNAGKSTLFNRLLGQERAIVTEVPGTTRDILREPVVIDGLLFMLQDTAGLRGTEDPVENIGVNIARTAIDEADVVIYLVDGSDPLPDGFGVALDALDKQRAIVAINKLDRPHADLKNQLQQDHPGLRILGVSAKTGDGLAALRKTLVECVGRDGLSWIARERVVLNARLVFLLKQTRSQLDVLDRCLEEGLPLEILALEARQALQAYDAATGRRYSEDLLDAIFSRFCIGK